ncbi:TetR/AcrR family transcriptional regulator [Cellulomonas fengjieae]|uniref:TetR/AcrR family transcriptional regulator n=1 Tax=Cellulomonas fengjieae TaxID=2819978 RepID=A0ABS3SMR0_9CELL|nr:TetR/AcrR family transcriptional regulator [Cellulomonas fengjieae]MBO3086614.1 TetR/AcrR family transcriptional regulator [Cellulomonas fengjieae]MBO3100607.1 TetR/AcrR family transcriptional regulator [Cellulomonas fengjieae]QVI66537.1 TetR/AcrR family transcriptional regulator [Cellulomonas fengjieae]
MRADSTEPATRTGTGADTRARILGAANELFYAHGIRATSADRIIEQVGITKVTFYRHFRSKSDLVVAYLGEQAAGERAWIDGLFRAGDAVGSLHALAADIGSASCRPGFRGCAFINAAAEFSDPADPVRQTVDEHRRWMLGAFARIAAEAGVSDVDSVARQLMILRDGAMVNGYLDDPTSVADSLGAAFTSVIATARS